jgi:hypothetical protein
MAKVPEISLFTSGFMTNTHESVLRRLLLTCCSSEEVSELMHTVHVTPAIEGPHAVPGAADLHVGASAERHGGGTIDHDADANVSRAVLTQALNLLLFRDLLTRVPTGKSYVADCVSIGRHVFFDHGALRTVALTGMGDLPAGEEAITRVLLPLGYTLGSVYPLDRLGMTGRSYTHADFPEELPQFFVSELHPERFSPAFQEAVTRVTASSRDPLTAAAKGALAELVANQVLPFERARAVLPSLLACFQRQHAAPRLSDYQTLLAESAEMAWIATEGNSFNHATDRVTSLEAVVEEQRRLARPLKDSIEVSRSGRVRQTAFKADLVERDLVEADGSIVQRTVPGSFFEFIQRERFQDTVTGVTRLDLAFDSRNAQGIFKMTAAA